MSPRVLIWATRHGVLQLIECGDPLAKGFGAANYKRAADRLLQRVRLGCCTPVMTVAHETLLQRRQVRANALALTSQRAKGNYISSNAHTDNVPHKISVVIIKLWTAASLRISNGLLQCSLLITTHFQCCPSPSLQWSVAVHDDHTAGEPSGSTQAVPLHTPAAQSTVVSIEHQASGGAGALQAAIYHCESTTQVDNAMQSAGDGGCRGYGMCMLARTCVTCALSLKSATL